MAESNFVDYVKIYCRSVMVVVAAISICEETVTIGLCCICVMNGMSLPAMAEMVPSVVLPAKTVKTDI